MLFPWIKRREELAEKPIVALMIRLAKATVLLSAATDRIVELEEENRRLRIENRMLGKSIEDIKKETKEDRSTFISKLTEKEKELEVMTRLWQDERRNCVSHRLDKERLQDSNKTLREENKKLRKERKETDNPSAASGGTSPCTGAARAIDNRPYGETDEAAIERARA